MARYRVEQSFSAHMGWVSMIVDVETNAPRALYAGKDHQEKAERRAAELNQSEGGAQ